jgi:hypothetical protein
MSHQVTAQTKLTDADLVRDALEAMGWDFKEDKGVFNAGSRYDGNFSIDSNTGVVERGYSNRREEGDVHMQYTLAGIRRQAAIEGQTIENVEQKTVNGKRCLEITIVK